VKRVLLCLLLGSCAMAADLLATDLTQPQSPLRPKPDGMTFVDQGSHDPRLKGYFTPDGFRVEIVAADPDVVNPVGMHFDTEGRLFVLEWTHDPQPPFEELLPITYRDGTKRLVPTMKKRVKDRIKVLTWNAETGTYSMPRTILEDELPSTILIHDGWLYTAGRSTIRRWKLDAILDGTNINAIPEIIAQGFSGWHHHQVSGLAVGHDGWLYVSTADSDNVPEGSDGVRAEVLMRQGGIYRCRPDGSKLHLHCRGLRNPFREAVQDGRGHWFHIDNDDSGGKYVGCRLVHLLEEADYGWRLNDGARCCVPDKTRSVIFGERPGTVAPMLKTGRGAPAGLLAFDETTVPELYRGWLLNPDVLRQSVRAYRPAPTGSTFEIVQEFEWLKSSDPLFRPCHAVTGPDGAIYVCDWRTNSDGGGRLFGDGRGGRIYRIRWAGGKLPGQDDATPEIPLHERSSWKTIVDADDATLIKTLETESLSRRQIAMAELRRRPAARVRPTLLTLLSDVKMPLEARIAAVGVVQQFWNADVETALIAALDAEPDLRRLAADALSLSAKGTDAIQTSLFPLLNDGDKSVRRAAILAYAKLFGPAVVDLLGSLLRNDDGKDPALTDAIVRALERTGKPGVEKIIDLARTGTQADREIAVQAYLGLRIPAGHELLPAFLADPHLTNEQRALLIRSAVYYPPERAFSPEGLFDFVLKFDKPDPLLLAAILDVAGQTRQLNGPKATLLLERALSSPATEIRRSAIKAIDSTRLAAASTALVARLKERPENVDEIIDLLKAVATLKAPTARDDVDALLKQTVPTAVAVEALRTLAVLDADRARVVAEGALTNGDAALQAEAVRIVGTTPAGAIGVGRKFIDRKLPKELLPAVSEVLRSHAAKNPEASKLLTDVMRGGLLLNTGPAEVERIRQMVISKGDPARGRQIYLNNKLVACASCHTMEGQGGQVGPDLTRMWDAMSVEKIIESLVEPGKEIKEGFTSYRVVTKDGKSISGLKIADTATEITLRDATGRDHRIPRGEIEELQASKTSLMPDNVVSQLSYDQFIDLVAFLKNRQAQESLRMKK
jgi:quinoprotein glucose dehydrogenase